MASRRETLILNRQKFDSLRHEKGLSLDRLARAADVSTSTVALVSRGATPGPESCRRIAGALGVDPGVLWEPLASTSKGD